MQWILVLACCCCCLLSLLLHIFRLRSVHTQIFRAALLSPWCSQKLTQLCMIRCKIKYQCCSKLYYIFSQRSHLDYMPSLPCFAFFWLSNFIEQICSKREKPKQILSGIWRVEHCIETECCSIVCSNHLSSDRFDLANERKWKHQMWRGRKTKTHINCM